MTQEELIAWGILLFGWVLPLAHTALSPRGGAFTPPPGSRCPLGPRTGWLTMVLLLGPIGWLMYLRGRTAAAMRSQSTPKPSDSMKNH